MNKDILNEKGDDLSIESSMEILELMKKEEKEIKALDKTKDDYIKKKNEIKKKYKNLIDKIVEEELD